MRRTNQEFHEEVLRRQREYAARQKQRRKKVMTTALCVIMVIFGGAMTLPFLGGMGGSAAPEAAASMEGAMQNAAEAPAAAEPEYAMGQYDSKVQYARDQISMVMIDGVLYLDTGYYNGEPRKCGTFDGEITSEVDGSRTPTENDQSNFGTGYGYQYGSMEGTVEIYMNGKWRIFATEEAMAQLEFPE